MTDNSLSVTNTPSSQQELDVFVAKVAVLTQMSLDMTQLCVDVQTRIPRVLAAQAAAAFDAATADAAAAVADTDDPVFVAGVPRTPDQVAAANPPVTRMILTGMLSGSAASQLQFQLPSSCTHGLRRRVNTRMAALQFYRTKYQAQEVHKWMETSFPIGTTPQYT
ncbi:hypothetical protein B0H10DRAFT_1957970 [Mycena sp. CBHHK59/15]|nr:hypothetical protein B0H10DRAFT_1957970 [Mycena sp. CBHHK59/15]